MSPSAPAVVHYLNTPISDIVVIFKFDAAAWEPAITDENINWCPMLRRPL